MILEGIRNFFVGRPAVIDAPQLDALRESELNLVGEVAEFNAAIGGLELELRDVSTALQQLPRNGPEEQFTQLLTDAVTSNRRRNGRNCSWNRHAPN